MSRRPDKRSPAIESLKERMARDPFSRAFLQLAEEYRREGNFEEAVRVCQEGLARHPTYHTARIALGRTYLESGNLEEARRALSEVLELAPENHLAGKLLAEVQRRLGDARAAAETYRTILRHYPGDQEVNALLQDLLKGGAPAAGGLPATGRGEAISRPPASPAGDPAPRPAAPPPAPAPGALRPATHAAAAPAQAVPAPRPAPAPAPGPAPGPRPRPADPAIEYHADDLASPGPPAGEAAGDVMQTNTLAELYLRQGLVERAVEVYRAMLRVDPGNGRARRRLQELTGSPGSGVAGAAAGGRAPNAAAPTEPEPAARAGAPGMPAEPPGPGAGIHRDRIVRLERWLGRIRGSGAPGAGTGPA